MKMTHALVQAGKLHGLPALPGAGHWALGRDGAYINELMRECFIEHLGAQAGPPGSHE